MKDILNTLGRSDAVYLTCKDVALFQVEKLRKIFPGKKILYAIKAQPPLAKSLVNAVDGYEISNPSECRFLPTKTKGKLLITNYPSLNKDDREKLLARGIIQAVDSVEACEKLIRIKAKKAVLRIDLKAASDFTSCGSFGIDHKKAVALGRTLQKHGIEIYCVGAHMGSFINANVKELAKKLEILTEIAIKLNANRIDVGGGIRGPTLEEPDDYLEKSALVFKKAIDRAIPESIEVILEPGRAIAAPCALAFIKVNDVVKLDGYLRVSTSGSVFSLFQEAGEGCKVNPPIRLLNAPRTVRQNIKLIGPTCTGGDCLASNIMLPKPKEGDVLAFEGMGAYSLLSYYPDKLPSLGFCSHKFPVIVDVGLERYLDIVSYVRKNGMLAIKKY